MREALKKNIKKYREKEHVSPAGGGVVLVVHYFTTPRRADKKKREKEHVSTEGRVVLLVILPVGTIKKKKGKIT